MPCSDTAVINTFLAQKRPKYTCTVMNIHLNQFLCHVVETPMSQYEDQIIDQNLTINFGSHSEIVVIIYLIWIMWRQIVSTFWLLLFVSSDRVSVVLKHQNYIRIYIWVLAADLYYNKYGTVGPANTHPRRPESYPRTILCMRPANERWRYTKWSLIFYGVHHP